MYFHNIDLVEFLVVCWVIILRVMDLIALLMVRYLNRCIFHFLMGLHGKKLHVACVREGDEGHKLTM